MCVWGRGRKTGKECVCHANAKLSKIYRREILPGFFEERVVSMDGVKKNCCMSVNGQDVEACCGSPAR